MNRMSPYFKQVELLVQILPVVGSVECFALKGGTAINLFYRDMPRLSVDIDLVYVPIKDRESSLGEISEGFLQIGLAVEKSIPNINVHYSRMGNTAFIIKVIFQLDKTIVKLELSPVLRGTVYKPELLRIGKKVEETFGFAEVPVVSFEELYAGKILAALDRQHPRDLFDIKLLLENEGITPALKDAFLIYLISHNRRFLEILKPSLLDIRKIFEIDFQGMTAETIHVYELEKARIDLIEIMNRSLTVEDKKFLLQFKEGKPDWNHFSLSHIRDLPAVRWKLHNLDQMKNSERIDMIKRLREFFEMQGAF